MVLQRCSTKLWSKWLGTCVSQEWHNPSLLSRRLGHTYLVKNDESYLFDNSINLLEDWSEEKLKMWHFKGFGNIAQVCLLNRRVSYLKDKKLNPNS
jgi:hypothetical protein